MKRIFPLVVLALAMLFLFAAQVEGAKAYTHWELISTDTLADVEACTLYTQTHRVFTDSLQWHLGFSTDQANDSVDLVINAYWGVDSTAGPWTDAQAVVASHQIDDYIMTTYCAELQSKYFEWCMIIVTGTSAKNGLDTIVKTYIGYRKFWEKE